VAFTAGQTNYVLQDT